MMDCINAHSSCATRQRVQKMSLKHSASSSFRPSPKGSSSKLLSIYSAPRSLTQSFCSTSSTKTEHPSGVWDSKLFTPINDEMYQCYSPWLLSGRVNIVQSSLRFAPSQAPPLSLQEPSPFRVWTTLALCISTLFRMRSYQHYRCYWRQSNWNLKHSTSLRFWDLRPSGFNPINFCQTGRG
jgi:hypothetical protein